MDSAPPTDGFARAPWRRRVLVLLLAVVTAWGIVLALTRHAGERGAERAIPAAPTVVGGKADVVLVAPSASAAR